MILYHGSNTPVEEPAILPTRRALDFGAGFYTTSDFEQAKRWAQLQAFRRKSGKPTVTTYLFDDVNAGETLSIMHFSKADKEWLEFVAANRKGVFKGETYDMVTGPVANDVTMTVISDYIAGNITSETALILLKPQKLADQYAFLTEKSLGYLTAQEVKILG